MSWFRAALAAVTATVIALVPTDSQANPHLEEADKAVEELDYGQAAKTLKQALEWGRNSPSMLRDIYRKLGEVYASLDDATQAETYFHRLFALDPGAKLAPDSSPKIELPFSAAFIYMKDLGRIEATCEANSKTQSVTLVVKSDPLEMITGVRVRYRQGEDELKSLKQDGKGKIAVTLPTKGRTEYMCSAIDEFGNNLVEFGSLDKPLVIEPVVAVVAPPPPPSRPIYKHWIPYAVGSGLLAGASVFFAVQARSAENDLAELNRDSSGTEYDVARSLERRGSRYALATNIGFATAGVCAAVAGYFFWRQRKDGAERPRPHVVPTATPERVTVTVGFSF